MPTILIRTSRRLSYNQALTLATLTKPPPSTYQRNLQKEIAGYFIVVLLALPIRLSLMTYFKDSPDGFGYFVERYLGAISMGLIGAVFISKLRLRYKLALTFFLVAL